MSSSSRDRGPPSPLSSSDVAFAGLRLVRREPRTWAVWSGLCLLISLVLGAATVVLTGPAMMRLQAVNAQGPAADKTQAMAAFAAAIPGNLMIVAASILFYGVMNAAVLRAVLKPGQGGAAHLRLGADELRQIVVLMAMTLLMGVVAFAILFVTAIVAAFAAVLMGGAGAMAAGGANPGVIVGVVLLEMVAFVVAGAVILFIGVRLSLAAPLTFATGRIRVFGSWALTRGRFWPLFGAYVLALAVLAVAGLALLVVFGVIAATLGGGVAGAGFMMHPDMTSLATYFTPLQVLYLVVCAPLSAAWIATQAGAPADAYAQITRAESPASVFGPSASDRSTAFGAHV